MEFVQPIRDPKQIQAIKKILLAQSARDHLLFVLGINCGLRISDILQLRIGDVITDRGKPKPYYELREQKTKKGRRFPFGKNVLKAIELYIDEVGGSQNSDSYLFKSRQGAQPITRQRAHQIINSAARSIGIKEKIGTHSLRKSFGYHAYKSGVDISLLQSIFNHSAPSVTLRYIGITQDDMDDVILNLNL
ncbi:Phage integrase family protein [Marininema mesophilum]|uniref:Phage integrase family protein n=1 Tax=Marininema mesophilum TaxID=1048340 RepID=A0A1H2T5F5_9BACL|nr:site-specific integrase [Marininema mesophilum]SDW38464.1 Phage integrase family protein [Marininema mesophilum]